MNKKFLISAFYVVFSLCFSSSILAQTEQILDFHSQIQVRQDASLTVIETISVYAAGKDIRRGIYRDFPTRYKDRYGNNYVTGFGMISAEKNGLPEHYRVENYANGKRIYLGQADVFLSPGQYTYKITYETTRQLGFFKDHDELYWNVTGNGWVFPIQKASAAVVLPPDAASQITETDAYTGYEGSQGKDFKTSRDFSGNPIFETTRALLPQQGLTIVVSWPRGLVAEPTPAMEAGFLVQDNQGMLVAVFGFFLVLGYYLLTWHRLGRDPEKGTIIPLFHPPSDFSPAGIRYLWKLGYDSQAFAAAVLNMAVKGYLKIEEIKSGLFGGRTYVLKKTGNATALTNEEEEAGRHLFGSTRQEIELKQENHVIMKSAIDAHKRILNSRIEKIYFLTNLGFFVLGLFLSLGIGLVLFVFLVSGILGTGMAFLFGGIILLLNILFFRLLKAPTFTGRKILDQIEGFRMFLSVAEKDRLNMLNPPEKTPELFEKYLPYALALDVEQKWAEQFSEVFARAAESGKAYHPVWYAGGPTGRFSAQNFSVGLGSSLTSAISSSSTAPGSSSGGGGGGSSGGGGGGGGGGGW